MTGVVRFSAIAVCAVFLTLVPAILLAVTVGETGTAVKMSLLLVLGLLLASLVLLTIRGRTARMPRMHGLLGVVVSWVASIAAATVLTANLMALDPAAAAFEATSALTTTGASVLGLRAERALPILFWRTTLEWLGGLLTLVCLMQIIAPAGLGGLPQFTARLFSRPSRGGDVDPGERTMAEEGVSLRRMRLIASRYAIATALLWIALVANGPPPVEALMLAMVTLGTGGFIFFDGALMDRLEPHTILVMALGFYLGATSILWQSGANFGIGRFIRRNVEAVAVLVIVALLAFAIAVRVASVSGIAAIDGVTLVEGLFAAAALVATSGLETRPGIVALLPAILTLTVVFAGASLFSTTGGVKLYRLLGLLRFAGRELERLIYPHSVSSLNIGGRPVADETLRAIWAYFVFAFTFVLVATFGLALGPFGFEAGFHAAFALFTSAGPLYEALTPATGGIEVGWPRFIDLGPASLLWACVVMLLGRLEILVVFAAFNLRFWFGR